jgi:hypothetical protein
VLESQRLNLQGKEAGKRKVSARLEELKVLGLQLKELPGLIQENHLPTPAISTGLRRLGEVLAGKMGGGGQGVWVLMTRDGVQEGGDRVVALATINSGADGHTDLGSWCGVRFREGEAGAAGGAHCVGRIKGGKKVFFTQVEQGARREETDERVKQLLQAGYRLTVVTQFRPTFEEPGLSFSLTEGQRKGMLDASRGCGKG